MREVHGQVLAPRSPLGSVGADAPGVIVAAERLRIVEEPFLGAISLRQARVRTDHSAAAAASAQWQLELPEKPNGLTGSAQRGCAWVEPNAWLLTASDASRPPSGPTGVLITDLSDRFAAFRLTGPAAAGIIAAGCDPAIVPRNAQARTRFAALTTAMIQRWDDQDWRILVDVSLAQTFADWLSRAAINTASP
jgi:heterotetrameric sarcosine oxidase gamma subunit